jgi:hypothetical protein
MSVQALARLYTNVIRIGTSKYSSNNTMMARRRSVMMRLGHEFDKNASSHTVFVRLEKTVQ